MIFARLPVLLSLPLVFCAIALGEESNTTPAVGKPKLNVTVSKETTYVIGPLRTDGYPDYVAALNQRLREGVSPENNAAVPLLQAFGPIGIPEAHRSEAYEQLRIKPLPQQGNYFVTQRHIADQWESKRPEGRDKRVDFDSCFDHAMERPGRKGNSQSSPNGCCLTKNRCDM